jgi:Polyketide cyclase / dehydrase and lipid transport
MPGRPRREGNVPRVREAAGEIEAVALVPAAPEDVFAFLSELANHWLLLDSHVDVVEVEGDRAVVRLRGPLGVRRTVRTRVTVAREPRLIIGIAELGQHTRARVSWTLAGRLGDTRVRLAAEVEHADLLDRTVLALGGRRWLERRFAYGLERLAKRFKAAPESTSPQSRPPAERSGPPSPSPPGPAYPSAGGSS